VSGVSTNEQKKRHLMCNSTHVAQL